MAKMSCSSRMSFAEGVMGPRRSKSFLTLFGRPCGTEEMAGGADTQLGDGGASTIGPCCGEVCAPELRALAMAAFSFAGQAARALLRHAPPLFFPY